MRILSWTKEKTVFVDAPEQMRGGFLERLERGSQLFDHDGDEAVEGAEEALDGGVAERQVSQSHDGVASHFRARPGLSVVRVKLVNFALNLRRKN